VKLVFVFDHFGPYHVARVGAAAGLPGCVVTGVELHPRSRTYGWEPRDCAGELGFRKVCLPRVELQGRAERRILRPHLERVLSECGPDVVFVNGWGDFMSLETIAWAKRKGVRVVVMSETRRVDGVRSWYGEWVKSRIVRLCDGGLCGGESHRRYLEELGLPRVRVALGYNAVDNEFFSKIRNSKLGMGNEEEFSVFGFQFPGDVGQAELPYFLASNRFVERKNVGRLIRAYAMYVKSVQQGKSVWPLVLLGDGELRGELEAFCVGLGLQIADDEQAKNLKRNSYKLKTSKECGLVVFAGFRQVEEVREFYSHAGVFIHPALAEPWGLVLNEAMASGLPVLSSRNVGAAEELLREGVNGYLFDPKNVEELAGLMGRMAEMPEGARLAMGRASGSLVEEWEPGRFAQGVGEVLSVAMDGPVRKAGNLDRIILEASIWK